MWWRIGNAPHFWGRGFGFESGTSHNDPDARQDNVEILRVERQKNIFENTVRTQQVKSDQL